MAGAAKPIVVVADVEPDPRMLTEPIPWTGFERLIALMEDWRQTLARATGAPVAFTWMVRVDHQIAAVYGDALWGFRRYAAELARLRERGDEVGLHLHFWRRSALSPLGWLSDFADWAWMEATARDAFAQFTRLHGRPPALFSAGSGYVSDRLLDLVEALGAEIDMTFAPGEPPAVQVPADEAYRGPVPSTGLSPRLPYRRCRHDFRSRAEDGSSKLWLFPMATTWECDESWHRAPWRRWRGTVERALDRDPELTAAMLRVATLGQAGLRRRRALMGLPLPLFAPRWRRLRARPLVTLVMRADVGHYEPQRGAFQAAMRLVSDDPILARSRFMTPSQVLGPRPATVRPIAKAA